MPRVSHWILKTEPSTYSWADLERDGRTRWDGVRNFQARNNLRAMQPGDLALIYHSVDEKALVGVAEVASEAYPDPSAEGDWSMIDIKPRHALPAPVNLAMLKADKALAGLALIRQSRLSVSPCTKAEFERILALAKKA